MNDDTKTFRAPGGLITPLIGIASIIWLLSSLTKWELLSTLIFIVVVCILYFVTKLVMKRSEVLNEEQSPVTEPEQVIK